MARLPAAADDLQVNCCKYPACTHFAAPPNPASTATPPPRHGIWPSAFYDGKCLISPKDDIALECLSCGESIPLKSNAAVREEVLRLRQRAGGPAREKAKKSRRDARTSPAATTGTRKTGRSPDNTGCAVGTSKFG